MTIPTCHPERKHKAKGLCKSCYNISVLNKELRKEYNKKHYRLHEDKYKERTKLWAKKNPEKYKLNCIMGSRRRRKENPEKHIEEQRLRRSRVKMATPSWLSKKDFEQMNQLYKIARSLTKVSGVDYTVDHIIPIKNKVVCGLHVPNNLQILTRSQNCAKAQKLQGVGY